MAPAACATMNVSSHVERGLDNLETDEAIYRTMLRDVYQNGQVLQNKKYRFLGYAYRAFLIGLILTLICLALEKFGILAA